MLVNVAKSNIGLQISRLQFNHHMLILKGERHDSPRLTLIRVILAYFLDILYSHYHTHIKQFCIHFEYDKVCKNDNH